MTLIAPAISSFVVTQRDAARLRVLMRMAIAQTMPREIDRLRRKLVDARLVPSNAVPRSVVTMHSRVVYVDADSGERHETHLVYPWACDGRGSVSVLDPIGTALLGAAIGCVVRVTCDDEDVGRLRVVDVPYQPEAAGHESP